MLSFVAKSAAAASVAVLLAACGASDQGASASGSTARSDYERPSDMALGDPNAPVTIIEYASVTCPGCAAFHATTYPELKEKYIDTGQVRFVFREFPTPPAPLAVAGFLLARCVAETAGEDGYFATVDALMRTQRQWIGENARTELLNVATTAGMSEAEFDACIQDEAAVERLRDDVTHGQRTYNINSTPSFIVNGRKLDNIFAIEDFDRAIEERLPADAS